MDRPKQPPKQEIKIADNIPGGEYANFMNIGFNKDEFHLNYVNISGTSGRIVSKIMTSPGHMKRIIGALQESIKKYETKFGTIEVAEFPTEEIGFKS